MKNNHFIGSKKFWICMTAILGTFILISGILLVCMSSTQKTVYVMDSTAAQPTQGSNNLDHSYEAVKDRVDSINDNYGQNVKYSYYGNTSTAEQMMRNRMFFTNLKSILVIVLIALVIVLVLVKGFGLHFSKKAPAGNAPTETAKQAEKPVQNPKAKPQTQPVTTKTEEKKTPPEERKAKPQEEDVQSVADSCQLP